MFFSKVDFSFAEENGTSLSSFVLGFVLVVVVLVFVVVVVLVFLVVVDVVVVFVVVIVVVFIDAALLVVVAFLVVVDVAVVFVVPALDVAISEVNDCGAYELVVRVHFFVETQIVIVTLRFIVSFSDLCCCPRQFHRSLVLFSHRFCRFG